MNFTGAKVKKSRALGVALTPKAGRLMEKRRSSTSSPGGRRRRRKSEYGLQLLEKQRLRFQYSVSEKYLQRLFDRAARMPGSTGVNLIVLLESRLDVLVLRANFAPTIYAARQYVTHGHFTVNGVKATIPSQRLKLGDVIEIKDRSKALTIFTDSPSHGSSVPYVESGGSVQTARFTYVPERHEIPIICEERLVVEFYSR